MSDAREFDSGFIERCRQRFGFLEMRYGCRVVATRRTEWRSIGYVSYRNATTRVKVDRAHEYGDVIDVQLGPLDRRSPLWLDGLVELRAPSLDEVRRSRLSARRAGWEADLDRQATLLPRYADDVLRGDFSIASELLAYGRRITAVRDAIYDALDRRGILSGQGDWDLVYPSRVFEELSGLDEAAQSKDVRDTVGEVLRAEGLGPSPLRARSELEGACEEIEGLWRQYVRETAEQRGRLVPRDA
jgi:hypothetical protein